MKGKAESLRLARTKELLEYAVCSTAPRAVWGGIARRRSWIERETNKILRAFKTLIGPLVGPSWPEDLTF
jgi:hypothetical protein